MRIVDAIVISLWRRNRGWLAIFAGLFLLAIALPPVRQLLMFDLFGSSLMWYQQAPLATREADPKEEFDFKTLPSPDVSTRFAALVQPKYGYGQTAYQLSQVQMPLPQAVLKANNAAFAPPPGGPPPGAIVTPTIPAPKPPPGNPQKEVDKLIQQYPRETWLIAHRLRETLSWMQDNRFAGLYEWQPVRPMKIPAVIPDKKPCAPYFTTQQWQQTFALTKQGQQLEPDNAFFDAVLIYLYLAAYRDNDAMRVLASVLQKSRYDDHLFAERRHFIRAHEKVRPLILEEKLALRPAHWNSSNLDRIAMLLSWQAWKMERTGQKTRGLKLRHQIAQFAFLMMRSQPHSDASYLAQSLVNKAYSFHPWNKFAPGQKPPKRQRGKISMNTATFANTAQLLGQNDIARETLRMAEKSAQTLDARQNDSSSQGLFERDYHWLGGWHELRLAFLVQFALMMAASTVLGFFLIASYNAQPSREAIIASTRWSLGFVVLCAALFLFLTLQQQATFSSPLYGGINISLGACVIFPIIVSALYTWMGAKKQLQKLRKTSSETPLEKRDILSIGVSWSFFVTAIAAIISWLICIYSVSNLGRITLPFITWNSLPVVISDDPEATFIIGAFLFGAIYVAWFFAWRAFTPKTLQPLLHGALRLHRNALSAFALCSVALYIIAILLSLPHRNTMNAQFENYLQGSTISRTQ
jgi:hypothetical protein